MATAMEGMDQSGDGEVGIDARRLEKEATRKAEKAAREEAELFVAQKAKATQKLQGESVQSVVAAIEVWSQC